MAPNLMGNTTDRQLTGEKPMARYRTVIVAAVALMLGPGAAAEAAPPAQLVSSQLVAPAQCVALLGCGADLETAVDLERKIEDNLWYGLALPIDYNTPERIPGDVKGIGTQWGDAGIWSGNYLAAESFRYAVAREQLRAGGKNKQKDGKVKDKDEDQAFWEAQQAQAKARIDAMVAQVDLRTNIARGWRGKAVQGEAGTLMLSCAPTNAPAGFGMPVNQDVRGPWRWTNDSGRPARLTLPEGDYICEASTTRDAYAGTLFGLLTAFDQVSSDDPALRAVIRDDILAIANYLLTHGWSWVRPDEKVSQDQYSNVVNPLMLYAPTYRLAVSQAARHVARVAGPATEAAKWEAVWAEELATQATAGNAISHLVNDPSPTADYYGFNLAHLMYFNLIRLAEGPAEKALFRRDFSIIDRQTSDDVNAFFEAVSYTFTGEPSRRDAAVKHLREWRDYRAKLDLGGSTNNSARCGTAIECVPEDQYDIITSTPAGDTSVTVRGSSSRMRAVVPLPVAERRPADFLWQRSPFTGLDGSVEATHQEPGIDYLLPYWMLRYYTEVAPPPLDPITTWSGPAFSGS